MEAEFGPGGLFVAASSLGTIDPNTEAHPGFFGSNKTPPTVAGAPRFESSSRAPSVKTIMGFSCQAAWMVRGFPLIKRSLSSLMASTPDGSRDTGTLEKLPCDLRSLRAKQEHHQGPA